MEKKRPLIIEVNYLYLVVAILLITVGGFFQARDIYSGIFITEYIIILLPVILLALFRKYKFKETFRLNKITLKQTILTILIVICSYPIAMFFNSIMAVIVSMFGELQQSPLPVPENTSMFLKSLFLFAITPGICEEVIFRGVIQSAYERIGAKRAIVITGVMFGVFHFNIQNFLAPTFLGILFGYMVYKTNSLYTSIIAHAVNNGIALILLSIVGEQEVGPSLVDMGQTEVLLIGLISLAVIAIVSSVIVYFLLKSLVNASKGMENYNYGYGNDFTEKIKFIHMIPIIVVSFLFLFSVFRYFQYITT